MVVETQEAAAVRSNKDMSKEMRRAEKAVISSFTFHLCTGQLHIQKTG